MWQRTVDRYRSEKEWTKGCSSSSSNCSSDYNKSSSQVQYHHKHPWRTSHRKGTHQRPPFRERPRWLLKDGFAICRRRRLPAVDLVVAIITRGRPSILPEVSHYHHSYTRAGTPVRGGVFPPLLHRRRRRHRPQLLAETRCDLPILFLSLFLPCHRPIQSKASTCFRGVATCRTW